MFWIIKGNAYSINVLIKIKAALEVLLKILSMSSFSLIHVVGVQHNRFSPHKNSKCICTLENFHKAQMALNFYTHS